MTFAFVCRVPFTVETAGQGRKAYPRNARATRADARTPGRQGLPSRRSQALADPLIPGCHGSDFPCDPLLSLK